MLCWGAKNEDEDGNGNGALLLLYELSGGIPGSNSNLRFLFHLLIHTRGTKYGKRSAEHELI
jgi:hypothetical protein